MNTKLKIELIDKQLAELACPTCEGTASLSSRISGYYRPIKDWNRGKHGEFKERKAYVV
jgi:anaerobic ribonucleoside-triphosphate reductase